MFRMARHFSELRGHFPGVLARVAVEREALGLAMEWAVAKGQTSEQLEDALAAYRDLPKLTPVADAIRAEAKLVEKTLDMPVSELRDWLIDTNIAAKAAHTDKVMAYLGIDMVTTRWERARARRVNRLIAKKAIETAMHEPVARPRLKTGNLEQDDPEIEYALRTTPLAKLSLFPSVAMPIETDDRNEVGRRAFVQVLAIRAWQLRHGGRFPDRLDALVPAELPSLPRDPYTGRSFGYVKSQGQPVLPLRDVLTASISSERAPPSSERRDRGFSTVAGPNLKDRAEPPSRRPVRSCGATLSSRSRPSRRATFPHRQRESKAGGVSVESTSVTSPRRARIFSDLRFRISCLVAAWPRWVVPDGFPTASSCVTCARALTPAPERRSVRWHRPTGRCRGARKS